MQEDNPHFDSRLTRLQRKELAVKNALRGYLEQIIEDRFPDLLSEKDPFPFHVDLNWLPGSLDFSPDLKDQVTAQCEAILSTRAVFHFGSVYDFKRKTSTGPHSRPPGPTHVFGGYDAMGQPVWEPFEQAEVSSGRELKKAQVSGYGKNSHAYSLLGQVTTGPFPLPPAFARITDADWIAVTLQIVETRDAKGHFSLELNELTGGLLPMEWHDLLQEPELSELAENVFTLRGRVEQLHRNALKHWKDQNTKALSQVLGQVPALLSDLCSS